jgi:hypothetical protein
MDEEALRGCSGQTERESPVMGMVVSFSPRNAALARKPLPAGTSGSVVIFPGIRYERASSISPVDEDLAADRQDARRDKPAPHH